MPRKCPICRTFTTRWSTRFARLEREHCRYPCSKLGFVQARAVVFRVRNQSERDWLAKQRKKRRVYGAAP